MVEEVIPSYPTYGESHPPFYERHHKDDDFSPFSVCHYLLWGTVLQGDSLGYVIFILKGLNFFGGGGGNLLGA